MNEPMAIDIKNCIQNLGRGYVSGPNLSYKVSVLFDVCLYPSFQVWDYDANRPPWFEHALTLGEYAIELLKVDVFEDVFSEYSPTRPIPERKALAEVEQEIRSAS